MTIIYWFRMYRKIRYNGCFHSQSRFILTLIIPIIGLCLYGPNDPYQRFSRGKSLGTDPDNDRMIPNDKIYFSHVIERSKV